MSSSSFLLFFSILLIISPKHLVYSRHIDNILLRSVLNCYYECSQIPANEAQDHLNNFCFNECFNPPLEKRGKFFMLG
ncbi:unnamed protein product [Schistosoma turkestanicum]|nr:unnamed protein product [Schistosoma turkestanicum]